MRLQAIAYVVSQLIEFISAQPVLYEEHGASARVTQLAEALTEAKVEVHHDASAAATAARSAAALTLKSDASSRGQRPQVAGISWQQSAAFARRLLSLMNM
jgi:hypothetical protein